MEKRPHTRGIALRLDQTLFYPTSGGQPCDLGQIADIPVLDVYEEDDQVFHVLPHYPAQDRVKGEIDWTRRFDHMQQHTGQHVLSAMFEDHARAKTISFHLSQEVSTIDLDVSDLDIKTMEQIEALCNDIVFQDRVISARWYSPEQVNALSLRKEPGEHDAIRVVEIEGIDAAACCGTHCQRTGQIGPIKIRKWEKRGSETRVEFLCGWRALQDYAWKHRDIMSCALALSIQDREVGATTLRFAEEIRTLQKQTQTLQNELLEYEAKALVEQALAMGNARVVRAVFDNRDATQVRHMTNKVIEQPGLVALFGIGGPKGQLIFGCAPDVSANMGQLIGLVCGRFGGRGGGHPQMAQGGGLDSASLDRALDEGWRILEQWLQDGVSGGKA